MARALRTLLDPRPKQKVRSRNKPPPGQDNGVR